MGLNIKQWQKYCLWFLFAIVVYCAVFLQMDLLPIQVWDESLFALRAHYMSETWSYLPNFNEFEGLRDHRNTKLPFTSFFQVLGIYLFGLNELGIRLPIAIIFLLFAIYLIYFLKKYYSGILAGVIAVLVLIASSGFVHPHMLRTGDQDVPFAIYLFLSTLFFHRYIQNERWKDICWMSFFFLAALLTKNVLAGLIVPGFLLFAWYSKSLGTLISDYRIYLAITGIVIIYGAVLLYFEWKFPGFLQQMWNYELMGRYQNTIEEHSGNFLYYLDRLFNYDMVPFMYLFPLSFLISFDSSASKNITSLIALNGFVFLSYYLIISFSETKTEWYHAALFIPVAVNIGLALDFVISKIRERSSKKMLLAVILISTILYAFPYGYVIYSIYEPEHIQKDSKYGRVLPEIISTYNDLPALTISDNNFGSSAYFYKEMYSKKGYNISYRRQIEYDQDEWVLTCLNNVLRPLEEKYEYEIIMDRGDCKLLKILREK